MTKKSCLLLPGLAALLFVLPGCSEEPKGIPHTHHEEFEVTLCGLCGDVKQDNHREHDRIHRRDGSRPGGFFHQAARPRVECFPVGSELYR